MLNDILNIEGASVLNQEQQKSIIGGGDGCYVFRRDSDGNAIGWSGDENGDDMTVGSAQFHYNNATTFQDGSYVSGYCCANCPPGLGGSPSIQ